MAHAKITSESTLAHLRRRPDNYVGQNTISSETVFLVKDGSIVREEIQDFNEALIHIFKEVIDNASDNIDRKWSSPQTYIKIVVDENSVEVTNDGMPIPVVEEEISLPNEITKKMEKHTMYRTQALFNYFRTGTNATNGDDESKIGVNGIGMKAVLGLSKYAKIHHGDPDNHKQLSIEYKNGMTKIGEPAVKAYKNKSSFTTIHYQPDFEWFGIEKFSTNHIGIMHALSICLAFTTGIKVTFNGETLKIPSMKVLGEMFFGSLPSGDKRQSLELKTVDGDQVLVMEQSLSEMEEFGVRHLSFVNGSYTRNGGNHVNYNANKIGKALSEAYGAPLKEADAKKFFIYIVNYRIRGKLQWSGQTKAALTAPTTALKRVEVEKKDMNKCKKWAMWNEIATFLEGKTNRDANKKVRGTTESYIGALGKNGCDAFYAGSKSQKEREKCELYLTEGLSAKALVDAGARYRAGSDYVGCLALRGKIVNVLKMKQRADQNDKQFLQLIRKMIGLKMGCKYLTPEECATTRYSKIIIATDKDNDGAHILLLLIVFFKSEHPGLLDNGIVTFLETPVLKTHVGKEVHRFFLREDFEDWLKEQSESRRAQAIKNRKFIKGLGGHNNSDDAEAIFGNNFFTGQILFKKKRDEDLLDIFFGKGAEKTKEKKDFMMATFYNHEEWIHKPRKGTMTFSEFIESRFTLSIDEQIHRAIPYVYDGLIESKKEIIFTALKNLRSLTKTVQFAMSVAVESAYDHGEQNLPPTVTKMTQTIIGANNIAVFIGDGIFGSRFVGTDEMHGAAAPRYTYVDLQPIIKTIFMEDDTEILEYEEKDGRITSPKYFLPIIPWFAVNGILHAPANTFSTAYPSYNPEDLVKWIYWWIGESFKDAPKSDSIELVPWFRGFRGSFEKTANGWISKGVLIKKDEKTYVVDEIAAGKWGCQLQEILESLADEKKIEKPRIMNIDTNTIKAEIKVKTEFDVAKSLANVLENKMPMTNVTLVHDKQPVTSNGIDEHLDEYARRRYRGYQDRRKYKMTYFEKQLKLKTDKINFIKFVLDGTINFKKIKDKEELISKLVDLGFTQDVDDKDDSWKHITTMTMLACTQKGIDNLEKEKAQVEERYLYYKENKPWKIWLDDLSIFQKEYQKYLKDNPIDVVAKTWKPK
jgi:DNA topoisomerase II